MQIRALIMTLLGWFWNIFLQNKDSRKTFTHSFISLLWLSYNQYEGAHNNDVAEQFQRDCFNSPITAYRLCVLKSWPPELTLDVVSHDTLSQWLSLYYLQDYPESWLERQLSRPIFVYLCNGFHLFLIILKSFISVKILMFLILKF